MASPNTLQLVFPAEHDRGRLDRGLAALVEGLSRAALQDLIRAGAVRVAGEVVTRPGTLVRAGQPVEVELRERVRRRASGPADPGALASPADFEVLFEDEHLAGIAKPAGMLAHPAGSSSGPTVAELAVARWGTLPALQGATAMHSDDFFPELLRQARAAGASLGWLSRSQAPSFPRGKRLSGRAKVFNRLPPPQRRG